MFLKYRNLSDTKMMIICVDNDILVVVGKMKKKTWLKSQSLGKEGAI